MDGPGLRDAGRAAWRASGILSSGCPQGLSRQRAETRAQCPDVHRTPPSRVTRAAGCRGCSTCRRPCRAGPSARPAGGGGEPCRRPAEVTAGRWTAAGRHTVVIGTGTPEGEGLWWSALWETGAGAVLDGVTALPLAAGTDGVHRRDDRRGDPEAEPPTTGSPVSRCEHEVLTSVRSPEPQLPSLHPGVGHDPRGAEWARTDRTAAADRLPCRAAATRGTRRAFSRGVALSGPESTPAAP